MRILVVHAHPTKTSFGAALHAEVLQTLRRRGHEVDDCDLYDEAFDPVLSERALATYHDIPGNRAGVETYVDRLLAAEALVLVYPVWNEGFPAILKGFFDRVFLPGVSFEESPDGAMTPCLKKIRKLAAVCTYGGTRLSTFLLGDPPRRVVKRLVRAMPGHGIRCDYVALYDMNRTTIESRAAFQVNVQRVFERW